jgi:hypothetical protein
LRGAAADGKQGGEVAGLLEALDGAEDQLD